ncbi:MAG: uroporphyrinogen-III synthase [Chloroflexota bacterium]|nr:uroporphyrinogen-III synthase [Chloroflexota bacterium]MDE2898654.1 uroporphyrinogen-III synthase [Chloroflexota bacterium]
MKRPRVVVTRPSSGPDRLTERLQELGCEVVAAPAIQIGPPRSYEALDALVRAPGRSDYLLFMSRNAVRYYVQRARRLRRGGLPVPASVQVGVVGTATGAVAERAGIHLTVQSNGRTGADLADSVAAAASPGARVAIVQAEDGREEPAERLRSAGLSVTRVPAYRTRPAAVPREIVAAVRNGQVDALAFASPSSAVGFAVALGGLGAVPDSVAVAAMGPTTAAACERAGRVPDVVAGNSSAEALAEAVVGGISHREGATTA